MIATINTVSDLVNNFLNYISYFKQTCKNYTNFDDELLTELDGFEQNRGVVFMAATNRPDLMDPALLRPGRIDKLIRIDAPDKKGRLAIFKVHTKKVNIDNNVLLEELVEKTNGFTGADIEGLIRSAALIALKESGMKPVPVTKKHFDKALELAKASITKKVEDAYDEIGRAHV